ncbi:cell division ATPase MinD [Candidatus Aenigmatarchaeota archaeon]
MTRIIGVISGKGGVGKTTLVVNLGAALASKFNKDVIIVDCNVTSSHLGLYLGMYYYPTSLNQVLLGEERIDKAIYNYSIPGLRIIPASLSLNDLKGVDVAEMKKHIKELFGSADIILLDGAPGFGREVMACIQASDEVIFVTTPYVPPLIDTIKCFNAVNEIGAKPIGIVLNMCKEGRHELLSNDIEQMVELPVISQIPRDKNVLKSLSAKLPVIDYNPRSKASREIIKLAAHIAGEEYKHDGLFSRISSKFKRGREPRRELLDFKLKSLTNSPATKK